MKELLDELKEQAKVIKTAQSKIKHSLFDYNLNGWSLKDETSEKLKNSDINDFGNLFLTLFDLGFNAEAEDLLRVYVARLILDDDEKYYEVFKDKLEEKWDLIEWVKSVFNDLCFFSDIQDDVCECETISTEELKSLILDFIQKEIKQ